MDHQSIISNNQGENYYEIFITMNNNKILNDQVYDINIDKDQFYKILASVTDYKYFQKEYKEYVYTNIVYRILNKNTSNTNTKNNNNDLMKVFKQKPLKITNYDKFIVISYNKNKLSILNFPSTTNIDQINYVKTLVFRITNRIYINFNITIDNNTKNKTYSIFMNYNNDSNYKSDTNIDINEINKTIKSVLSKLI